MFISFGLKREAGLLFICWDIINIFRLLHWKQCQQLPQSKGTKKLREFNFTLSQNKTFCNCSYAQSILTAMRNNCWILVVPHSKGLFLVDSAVNIRSQWGLCFMKLFIKSDIFNLEVPLFLGLWISLVNLLYLASRNKRE